jgi:ABC-type multidrug transport system fused ATPase/permease subunit
MSVDENRSESGRRERKRSKSTADFWRACRYLAPHRKIVVISVICAILVGLTFASGLGALLPVLRILVNGDTMQTYVQRQAVQQRLQVRLAEETDPLYVHVENLTHTHGPAGVAGIHPGDRLQLANHSGRTTLETLATDDQVNLIATDGGKERPVSLNLPQAPFYIRDGLAIAARLPANPVKSLAVILGFIGVLTIVGNTITYFQDYYSEKAATLAVNDIRRQLYDHVLHIPMAFFGLKGTSDVTSRLVQDSQGLQEGFKTVLGQSIQEPIKAFFAFAVAIWLDWRLTLFIVVFAPIMFTIIRKFGKKMRRASRRALQSSSSMLGQIEGTLIGVRVVKAAGAERFERRRYSGIMNRLIGEQLRMSRIDAASTPVLETLTYFVVACIVLYAAYRMQMKHSLETDKFMGVMACLMGIGESLRKTSKLNNALQKSNSAAARIFETLDVPVERPRLRGVAAAKSINSATYNDKPLIKLPPIQREVRFEGITFTYPNGTSPALRQVDLTVPKGKCVAVVGRNGSGKTTLLSLLPRFYEAQEGRISIDGLDIRGVTLRSLREQIGIVTQEAVIFPGTIAENIAYGHPLASRLNTNSPAAKALRVEIEAAAKRAFAHEFILEKAGGYDTVLGEHGAQLSGGQRQRLCIARAILRATPILILDEATSQVDAESEHLIQQAIDSLIHERTTFVIAHRFSTILSADSIVVLDRGQVVGQGKHQELLETCEVYQQLYERQLFATPAA